ncbi:hypothetical protein HYDPIDRAFT_69640, partial [Hydnomerulius pinastri MD-312]
LLPLAALAIATGTSQCNTGSINCCNQVQTASQATQVLSKYNLVDVAAAIEGLVGTDCTPITVIGTGSGCTAEQQPVCCTHNDFNGAVNLGCS